jgi:hypothetical protein
MTLSTIHPEIFDTEILEETPMTDDEQRELIEVETSIKANLSDRVERDLAIGKGLLTIFRKRLYRSPGGGRTWEQYLEQESHKLTPDGQVLERNTATRLRGFYQFRVEVLQRGAPGPGSLPLPTSAKQARPLIGQLDTHPEAAIAIWKAACSQAGAGKVPTFDQVNRARLSYLANEENEARRLSAKQQEAQQKATAASTAARPTPAQPTPTPRVPDPAPEPAIPAWQLEKDPDAIDAGVECRKVWTAINEASKALSHLRGILYSQTAKHGSAYLDGLRQIDAGTYSLNNIDDQIDGLKEDTDFIVSILSWEGEPGELNRSTVEAEAFPTR